MDRYRLIRELKEFEDLIKLGIDIDYILDTMEELTAYGSLVIKEKRQNLFMLHQLTTSIRERYKGQEYTALHPKDMSKVIQALRKWRRKVESEIDQYY